MPSPERTADLSKSLTKEQIAQLEMYYSREAVERMKAQASGQPVSASVPVEEESGMADDYTAMTNDQLREELKARDLSTSGAKDELVARLREDDASA